MIMDDFAVCEHRWKTTKFVQDGREWTHYMVCVKCGTTRTIMQVEKRLRQ